MIDKIEVVRHPPSVVLIPMQDARHVILIRQFRIAVERELMELPAGRLEPGEEPASGGRRELEEEIGYRANELFPLVTYFSAVGCTDERMHIFLARGLEKLSVLRQEADERITQVVMPTETVREKPAARAFEDATS